MKIINSFAIALFLLTTTQLSAQLSAGPKGGYNFARLNGDLTNTRYIPRIQIGAMVNYAFNEMYGLQTGLMYKGKGSLLYYDENDFDAFTLNYLEIPVNNVVTAEFGIGTLLVYIGPYVAFALNGAYKFLSDENDVSNDIPIGTSEDDEILPMDFGINLGAGFIYEGLEIQMGYGGSFVNISNVPNNRLTNSLISISAAYFFEINFKRNPQKFRR